MRRDTPEFARLLRAERERAGLTQTELAKRAGTRPSDISDYERGVREPRGTTLVKLARALDTTPSELVTGR